MLALMTLNNAVARLSGTFHTLPHQAGQTAEALIYTYASVVPEAQGSLTTAQEPTARVRRTAPSLSTSRAEILAIATALGYVSSHPCHYTLVTVHIHTDCQAVLHCLQDLKTLCLV